MKKICIIFALFILANFQILAQEIDRDKGRIKIYPLASFYIMNSTLDYSFGAGYEININNNGTWKAELPVFWGMLKSTDQSQYRESFKNIIKVSPDITYYPFVNKIMRYGIGISLNGIFGQHHNEDILRGTNDVYNFRQFGFLGRNRLEFMLSKGTSIGLEAAVGPSLLKCTELQKIFGLKNLDVVSLYHFNVQLSFQL